MPDWDGKERRISPPAIDEYRLARLIRDGVRAELDHAIDEGRLLGRDDVATLHEWIRNRQRWEMLREKMVGTAAGWLVILFLSAIGLAVWEYFKSKVNNGVS